MSLACREGKVIRATTITTLAQTKHRGMYFGQLLTMNIRDSIIITEGVSQKQFCLTFVQVKLA